MSWVGFSEYIKRVKIKLFGAFHPSRDISGKFSNDEGKNKFILMMKIKLNNKIKLRIF